MEEKWIHFKHPEISHHLMDRVIKQWTHQFHKIFFHTSKCLACNAEKILQLKIYTNTQIIICDQNDSK